MDRCHVRRRSGYSSNDFLGARWFCKEFCEGHFNKAIRLPLVLTIFASCGALPGCPPPPGRPLGVGLYRGPLLQDAPAFPRGQRGAPRPGSRLQGRQGCGGGCGATPSPSSLIHLCGLSCPARREKFLVCFVPLWWGVWDSGQADRRLGTSARFWE